jgi:tRNA threonylcarbamoyladenosine biosynthesis protein TsaE
VRLGGPADTHALGVSLGRRAFAGATLALFGDLGAGKTALARGLAEGLGVPGRVQSPTFGLVHEHRGGRLLLLHADWYRLAVPDEVDASGLFELGADGVVAIEWPDRFPELLPAERLEIHLAEEGDGRRAELRAFGDAHARWAAGG